VIRRKSHRARFYGLRRAGDRFRPSETVSGSLVWIEIRKHVTFRNHRNITKLPRSMLKPGGCVESGGLWNLLGFIETKPLIRGGGWAKISQHWLPWNSKYIYILVEGLRFPGSRFRMLLNKYLYFQMEVIYILARIRYPISYVQKPIYFSQTPKLTWTYEWIWTNISTEHTSYSRARSTNYNINTIPQK
jgi:hypothetical protein